MAEMTPKAARTLIRGLLRGTVRPGGAKHFHCGHEHWIAAQLEEIAEIEEDGGAVVHFVRGAYGEGKTHFLHYVQEIARERRWATAHVECRKDKAELDHFETMYPTIVQKLRLFPDVLENEEEATEDPAWKLLDLWTKKVFRKVGHHREAVMKPFQADDKIFELLQGTVMRRNLPGDLQRVLCAYPRAVLFEDYTAQTDLISWLKGETRKIHIPSLFLSKPGQRVNAPGVDQRLVGAVALRPITAATSLDVFRGLIWVLSQCGYKGLILSIDEVEQIARLSPSVRRERSLQTLREFVDNTDGDVGLEEATNRWLSKNRYRSEFGQALGWFLGGSQDWARHVLLGLDLAWADYNYKKVKAIHRLDDLGSYLRSLGFGGLMIQFDELETITQLWGYPSRRSAYRILRNIVELENVWSIFATTDRLNFHLDWDRGRTEDPEALSFLNEFQKFPVLKPPLITGELASELLRRVEGLYRKVYIIKESIELAQVIDQWKRMSFNNPRRLIRHAIDRLDRNRPAPMMTTWKGEKGELG